MNPASASIYPDDCSTVRVEIHIEESWIDKFLSEQQLIIPINEKINLRNLKINLLPGILNIQADIVDKEGSSIDITSQPKWNPDNQHLSIENLKIKAKSKNLLLKGAGWFAQHFLNAKLDQKIEEEVNILHAKQLEKLKKDPVIIPIPKAGNAIVEVRNIIIHELIFVEHGIKVIASIEGLWKVNLKNEG